MMVVDVLVGQVNRIDQCGNIYCGLSCSLISLKNRIHSILRTNVGQLSIGTNVLFDEGSNQATKERHE
jgi:hypothetical protein